LPREQKLQVKKEAVKQGKKKKAAQIEKVIASKKDMIQINEYAGQGGNAMVKPDKTEGEERNVDAVTTSLEQVKNYWGSIIEMDESTLKALCKEKGILPK
jgi:hypothetical protein